MPRYVVSFLTNKGAIHDMFVSAPDESTACLAAMTACAEGNVSLVGATH